MINEIASETNAFQLPLQYPISDNNTKRQFQLDEIVLPEYNQLQVVKLNQSLDITCMLGPVKIVST